MRHTLPLVAALGLIAVAGPSALAQEQDPENRSSQPATPTTSEPTTQPTQGTTPAVLPTTYTQPGVPGQVVSPYAPSYPGTATPCGHVMPSAHVPGTVAFGSQFPQYQPYATNGSYPQMMPYSQPGIQYAQPTTQYAQPTMQYAQPAMQYAQPTAMPVAGSVAGGVITQTEPLQLSGATYQPFQPGMTYTNGMTYQPFQSGMVHQAGALGAYSDQPVILSGYADGSYNPVMTTNTQSGRRGLFGRRR